MKLFFLPSIIRFLRNSLSLAHSLAHLLAHSLAHLLAHSGAHGKVVHVYELNASISCHFNTLSVDFSCLAADEVGATEVTIVCIIVLILVLLCVISLVLCKKQGMCPSFGAARRQTRTPLQTQNPDYASHR